MAMDTQFKIRLPTDLKARLEAAAEREGKSITAVIVKRLEASFSSTVAEMVAARAAELTGLQADLAQCQRRAQELRDELASAGGKDMANAQESLEWIEGQIRLLEFLEPYCRQQLQVLLGDMGRKA